MSTQDFIDLLIVVAWTYGNGFVFAWFFGSLGVNAHRTGLWFALIGWILAVFGIAARRRHGKFPLGLAYLISAVPLLCSFVGLVWWAVETVQRWLGIN